MIRPPDLRVRSAAPADTEAVARAIAALCRADDVIVLGGDLGAGKTTFTKALAAGLGVTEQVTSPTFTLAQQYTTGRLPLHHLDVYRIDQLDEVVDLALPELYESRGVVVIEWGDTIAPALPASFLALSFEFGDGDNDRLLELRLIGPGWQPRLEALRESLAPLAADGAAT